MANKTTAKSANKTKDSKSNKSFGTGRPPIVTIMGHVDHGKTTLLDKIQSSNITAKEHGGITQHIGAYQVEVPTKEGKRKITFIDTPGHSAFSEMRMRGGYAADIVILVVAHDDGVMEQTVEAISHAKSAKVPIIVAVTKSDKASMDINKIKEQLSKKDVLVEDWGGNIVLLPVSAVTGEGVEELLEMVILTADLLDLKADPTNEFEGLVIEAHKDNQQGPTVSAVVMDGTLSVGMELITPSASGKVKALRGTDKKNLSAAYPGDPVAILGFNKVPLVGEKMHLSTSKRLEEQAEVEKRSKERPILALTDDKTLVLSVVLRADSQGTLEAVKSSLNNIEVEGCELRVLHAGVGDINDSDILLASSANAIVIGFSVKITKATADLAGSLRVLVRNYDIIYELLNEVEEVMQGMEFVEDFKGKGRAEVLKLFSLESGDKIAGVSVTHGKLRVGDKVNIMRKNEEDEFVIVTKSIIRKIRQKQTGVEKINSGNDCGLLLKPQVDFIIGDVLEVL